MNSTSACDRGGSFAVTDGGSLLVLTITGAVQLQILDRARASLDAGDIEKSEALVQKASALGASSDLDAINDRIRQKRAAGGDPLPRRAVFLNTGFEQACDLSKTLGCAFTPKGVLQADKNEQTNIPGVYVAGDASRDVQMVIVAAAEGVKAAKAINEELQREMRERFKA